MSQAGAVERWKTEERTIEITAQGSSAVFLALANVLDVPSSPTIKVVPPRLRQ
jgi:hypothetical protein